MNILKWTSALLLLLVLAEPASAQRFRRDSSSRYGRNSTAMKATLDDLADSTEKATCIVRDGTTDLVVGTVFSSDGWIVTKNSEIQNVKELNCVFAGDREFAATVVATDTSYDMALLKVEAKDLVAIEVADTSSEVDAGQIVVSCAPDGKVMSMGLVTAKPRRFSLRQRPSQSNRGFLGVVCRSTDDGLIVRTVSERSGADRAGLKRRDVITAIEGQKVTTTNELIDILKGYNANQTIQLAVDRGDDSINVEALLGKRPNASNERTDKWGGGPFSDRRSGFPVVIPHDSVIKPQQCGGPLLNSDGEVIGLNIARAIRVASYAVPIQKVKKFVDQNQRLTPTQK